jgi:ABC-type polysaccharide/polyol phosphate export permease
LDSLAMLLISLIILYFSLVIFIKFEKQIVERL